MLTRRRRRAAGRQPPATRGAASRWGGKEQAQVPSWSQAPPHAPAAKLLLHASPAVAPLWPHPRCVRPPSPAPLHLRRRPARPQALHALHALEQPELDARLEPVVELMRATFQVDYAALTLINSDRQVGAVQGLAAPTRLGMPRALRTAAAALTAAARAGRHVRWVRTESGSAGAPSPRQVYKTKAGGWPLDAVDRRFAFGEWESADCACASGPECTRCALHRSGRGEGAAITLHRILPASPGSWALASEHAQMLVR